MASVTVILSRCLMTVCLKNVLSVRFRTVGLQTPYPTKSGFKGEPDTCLFLLNAQGKVSGDSDFIFYNNLSSPEGAVKLVTGSQQSSIEIALDRVPANISKIAITVVIDGEDTISGLSSLSMQAQGIAEFQAETQGRSEKAIILGEVYRHNGAWKLRALGQGFNGGLEPLAISYGVDVAQPAPQPAKPASISLEKKLETRSPRLVSLAKKASVSLTKNKLDTLEAAVAFVLDASGSMSGQFSKDSRNGYSTKTVTTTDGPMELRTPRDRDGSFEPQLVKKALPAWTTRSWRCMSEG